MATWKKVIVSGSDISQLNNDANYLITGDSGITLSGSFSGSFEGNGSGLTGVVAQAANALTDGNGVADFTYDGSTAGVTVAVEADGTTLSVGASGVKVADAGITETQLNASVAGTGLAGGAGAALSVNVDDSTIEINSDSLRVKDLGIVEGKLAANSVTNAKIAADSITVAQLSGSAVVTAAEGIGSNDVDTAIPTAAAVKAYADSVVGAADLDFAGDSGTGAVDLDSQSLTIAGGSGLTSAASGQTLTLNISASGVTNAMLEGSITNAKLVNDSVTLGTTEVDLGTTAATLAGLTLTGAKASGSFSGSFEGDGSGLTGVSAQVEESLLLGNGLTGGTFNGSAGVTASINLDGSTLSVGVSGLKVADAGVTATQLNASVAGTGLSGGAGTALSVDYGSTAGTAAEGDSTVTFTGTANEITVSDATAQAIGGNVAVTIGLPDNVTISGDLTVLGTASFAEETNLAIADRFILLASGSTSSGDGGIVVQQTTQDIGEVFAFEDNISRWVVATAFNASGNTVGPDAFMATVSTGSFTSDTAIQAGIGSRYSAKGNVFVGDDEDIWIYS
jgi:hypothetical protein